jgi:hypothetical protein
MIGLSHHAQQVRIINLIVLQLVDTHLFNMLGEKVEAHIKYFCYTRK